MLLHTAHRVWLAVSVASGGAYLVDTASPAVAGEVLSCCSCVIESCSAVMIDVQFCYTHARARINTHTRLGWGVGEMGCLHFRVCVCVCVCVCARARA